MKQNLPPAKSIITNPSRDEIIPLITKMPKAQKTQFGNFNVNTLVNARSAKSTFFVSDKDNGKANISHEQYEKISKIQNDHIREQNMLLVEGYIGPDPDFSVGCQLYIEQSQANIAAMQQQLYFPSNLSYSPSFTIIYTPSLFVPGFPDNRLIAVDIENYTTRIMGTDYFGEAKKGGLRMWNKWVYDQGGLAVHAGCKVWPDVDGKERLALIIGLSGTGKTTTTFRQQMGSLPVQDDFCALFPGGKVTATENGCFAKTIGLDSNDEPTIYSALTQPDAWLENVIVTSEGIVDFKDGSITTNGRGTFSLDKINHRSPINLPEVDFILFLNRNFNLIPGVAKLKPEQAAAFFMLGETTGTSAGGAAEAGKFLRVPGTNPFFFGDDALQGNRFLELMKSMPNVKVYLLNTGRIGGLDQDPQSIKVHITDSSAIQEAIVNDSIQWVEDEDFGYFRAKSIPGVSDPHLLNPRLFYASLNRTNEFNEIKEKIKMERVDYLKKYRRLNSEILFD